MAYKILVIARAVEYPSEIYASGGSQVLHPADASSPPCYQPQYAYQPPNVTAIAMETIDFSGYAAAEFAVEAIEKQGHDVIRLYKLRDEKTAPSNS